MLITASAPPPSLGWIAKAESEPLDEHQRANLRRSSASGRMQACCRGRWWRLSLAGSKCEHAWRRQRKENDWAGLPRTSGGGAPVAGGGSPARRRARGAPYDAMLALYEPGMTRREAGSDLRRSDEAGCPASSRP